MVIHFKDHGSEKACCNRRGNASVYWPKSSDPREVTCERCIGSDAQRERAINYYLTINIRRNARTRKEASA